MASAISESTDNIRKTILFFLTDPRAAFPTELVQPLEGPASFEARGEQQALPGQYVSDLTRLAIARAVGGALLLSPSRMHRLGWPVSAYHTSEGFQAQSMASCYVLLCPGRFVLTSSNTAMYSILSSNKSPALTTSTKLVSASRNGSSQRVLRTQSDTWSSASLSSPRRY